MNVLKAGNLIRSSTDARELVSLIPCVCARSVAEQVPVVVVRVGLTQFSSRLFVSYAASVMSALDAFVVDL